jgi:hypothetical protein
MVAGAVTQPPVPQPPFRGMKRLGNILGLAPGQDDLWPEAEWAALVSAPGGDLRDFGTHTVKCLLGVYNSSTSLIKTQRAELRVA